MVGRLGIILVARIRSMQTLGSQVGPIWLSRPHNVYLHARTIKQSVARPRLNGRIDRFLTTTLLVCEETSTTPSSCEERRCVSLCAQRNKRQDKFHHLHRFVFHPFMSRSELPPQFPPSSSLSRHQRPSSMASR